MEGLEARPWSPARQCTATNRAGERCQRQPIPGGSVCVMHGGRAPQVQQSAKARLLAGADLAIDYLLNLLTPKPPCETCGRSDADRDPVVVKACQLVLDRSGFHPTLAIEQAPPENPYADVSEDELIERLEKLLEFAKDSRDFRRQHDFAHLQPAVQDAVLLDEFIVPEDDEAVLDKVNGAGLVEGEDTPPIHEPDEQNPSGNDTPDPGRDDK